MYSNVCTGALQGIYAYLVQTEVDVAGGLPGIDMVGCPAGEVRDVTITLLIQSRVGRKP